MLLLYELLNPLTKSIPLPPLDTKAFLVLRLYVSYSCTYYPIVSKCEVEIRRYYNIYYTKIRRRYNGAIANSRGIIQKRLNSKYYSNQLLY
jgi:hypothetical protein